MPAAIRPKPFKSERPWRHAIMRAVNRTAEDGKTKRLEILANRLVLEASRGDIQALIEIGNRLDGKSQQAIDASITIGPDESFIDFIRELSARRLAQQSEAGVIDVRAENPAGEPRALASPSPEGD